MPKKSRKNRRKPRPLMEERLIVNPDFRNADGSVDVELATKVLSMDPTATEQDVADAVLLLQVTAAAEQPEMVIMANAQKVLYAANDLGELTRTSLLVDEAEVREHLGMSVPEYVVALNHLSEVGIVLGSKRHADGRKEWLLNPELIQVVGD